MGNENKNKPRYPEKNFEYAKKHNYVTPLARGLSRGKSETIGLIIPEISDDHMPKLLDN